jgi:NADPH:quinone reductase
MVAAVRVHKTGGPEVLTYEDVEVGQPGPGQLRVKQHAAGLNYIDTYFRSGLYPAPSMPFVAGNEAAGWPTWRRCGAMRPSGWCRQSAP